MSSSPNTPNRPSQIPIPSEPQLEIVPTNPVPDLEEERHIIDGLLNDEGVELPWVKKSWRKERGQA